MTKLPRKLLSLLLSLMLTAGVVLSAPLTANAADAQGKVYPTIMDSFYDFSEPAFLKPANKPFVAKAEKEFKKFYQKFSKAFFECKSDRIATQMMQARLRAFNAGLQMERTDLKTWLKHIKNDVKI